MIRSLVLLISTVVVVVVITHWECFHVSAMGVVADGVVAPQAGRSWETEIAADHAQVGNGLVAIVRVSPADAEELRVGQDATICLSGLPYRSTPVLDGVLVGLSSNAVPDDGSGLLFHEVAIEVPAEETLMLNGQGDLIGMPVEVLMETCWPKLRFACPLDPL